MKYLDPAPVFFAQEMQACFFHIEEAFRAKKPDIHLKK